MKKVLLSVFAIVAIAISANAQTEFGITGGLNLASLTGDDADGVESKLGGNFGLLADIWVSPQWSVQPELKYSMQGAQFEVDSDEKLALDYINIPIKLKYAASEMFDLYAGPQVGFNVLSEVRFGNEEQDLDNVNNVDFGLVIGGEYVSYSGFGAGVGYNFGLSDIPEDGEGELKNSVFNVNLIYKFNQ